MGKGHRQRPAAISQDELEHNWFVVFGQPYVTNTEPVAPGRLRIYSELRSKMSPEAQARSATAAAEILNACPCGDPVEHDHF